MIIRKTIKEITEVTEIEEIIKIRIRIRIKKKGIDQRREFSQTEYYIL